MTATDLFASAVDEPVGSMNERMALLGHRTGSASSMSFSGERNVQLDLRETIAKSAAAMRSGVSIRSTVPTGDPVMTADVSRSKAAPSTPAKR